MTCVLFCEVGSFRVLRRYILLYILLRISPSINSEPTERSVFQNYPDSFIVGGKPPLSSLHEVTFAVTQRSIDKLDGLLQDVSFPDSPSYGQFMSRNAISELTSSSEATGTVLRFLDMIGVVRVKKTRYGEYISATAPVLIWEAALHAEFVVVTSTRDRSKMTIRTMEYTLPQMLRGHVITILNTVQTPLFDYDRHNAIVSTTSSDLRPIPYSVIQSLANGARGINPDSGVNESNSHGGGGNTPPSRPVAMVIGYTYPQLLNTVYNIESNAGNPAASQGVFETADQTLSRNDLMLFDSTFNIPYQQTETVIGGHVADVCTNVLRCGEADLDIQYLTGIAQDIPTT